MFEHSGIGVGGVLVHDVGVVDLMTHFARVENQCAAGRLTAIAEPDVGLITSVGAAHLEFFGSVSQVAKAKGELYAGLPPSAVAVVETGMTVLTTEP